MLPLRLPTQSNGLTGNKSIMAKTYHHLQSPICPSALISASLHSILTFPRAGRSFPRRVRNHSHWTACGCSRSPGSLCRRRRGELHLDRVWSLGFGVEDFVFVYLMSLLNWELLVGDLKGNSGEFIPPKTQRA